MESIKDLVHNIKIAIALLERDCTLYLGNITTHILIHSAEKIATNGDHCHPHGCIPLRG